jgi:hypothetical protein
MTRWDLSALEQQISDLQDLVAKVTEVNAAQAEQLRKAQERIRAAEAERDKQLAKKDGAYEERNRLVALLASMFPSGRKSTDIPGWNPEWHGAVYIDFPWGQASWHYHESQTHMFAHLTPYAGEWDGHTTETKYEAIQAASVCGDTLQAERDRAWNEAIEAAARFVDGLPSIIPIEWTPIGTRERMPRDYAQAIRSLAKEAGE